MAIILGRKPGGSGGGGGAPSGPAGGVLSGTYPNPGFASDPVLEADYDANTVLAANADNTPLALTMGASTILARLAAGNIVAATVAEIQALLGTTVKIGDIALDSTQAFTSIPGTYSDLRVVLLARGTQAAATVNVGLRFNSDSGTNYESNLGNLANNTFASAATASQDNVLLSVFPGSTAVANRAGYSYIDIPEYAGAFHKIGMAQSGVIYDTAAANYVSQWRSFQWRNTAAITRIDVIISAGAFAAGSTARLYGIP